MFVVVLSDHSSPVCCAVCCRDQFWDRCCSFCTPSISLIQLIEGNGLGPHLYADDTQVIGSCHPSNVSAFSSSISDCLRDVASWMKLNRLQLNSSKTEVMWCATSRRQHLLPASALTVDGVMIDPVTSVRDLGIYIDADLMRTHVQRTVSCCFAVLRQLRQIRRLIPPATFQALVVALVLSRLDYGNSVLIGLPTLYVESNRYLMHLHG